MFQSETQGIAVRRTIIITSLLLVPMFAGNLISLILRPFQMPYLGLFVVEIVQTLFFICVMLAFITRRYSPRKSAAGWSAYQAVTHILFTFSYGFQLRNQYSVIGRCFDVSTSGIYFLLYSFVLYTTIKNDSVYWRKKGALLRSVDYLDADSPNEALQRFLDTGVHIVQFKDLEIRREIGSGSYGDVHEAKYKGTIVAVKRLRMSQSDLLDVDHVTLLVQEAALFSRLRHPNVVQFMALSTSPPAIISEFCANGSLWDLMHPGAAAQPQIRLDWSRRIRIMKDVCRGMMYLHGCSPAIIHRDLKSANVLLDENWTAKVCDFGLARVKSASATMSRVGTPQWMAPELLREDRYSEKVDVFSFGVILWELATLQKPYDSLSPLRVIFVVGQTNARLKVPDDCPRVLKNLVEWCFSEDGDRPTFDQIMEILERVHKPEDLGFANSDVVL